MWISIRASLSVFRVRRYPAEGGIVSARGLSSFRCSTRHVGHPPITGNAFFLPRRKVNPPLCLRDKSSATTTDEFDKIVQNCGFNILPDCRFPRDDCQGRRQPARHYDVRFQFSRRSCAFHPATPFDREPYSSDAPSRKQLRGSVHPATPTYLGRKIGFQCDCVVV